MQDFAEKSFLKIDQRPLRSLKFLTAVCGAIFFSVSFVLTSFGIQLDAEVIAAGSAYAITTIVAYEEIVFALLRAARPIKLCLSVTIKVAALVLLLVAARAGGEFAVSSALLGVFSFIPATLLGLLRHKGAEAPASTP